MPEIIPAAPGWYVQETAEGKTTLEPVIAWLANTDTDGHPELLPFVDGGPGTPPLPLSAEGFTEFDRCIVYRPNYDPGAEQ
ncbi:hypothetical protein AB0N17_03570 [Streptomyces sp. NPDC051133]|uniref:hypothetical protein n=1 Tax=Streptomyces sp. NPDC051133 TaxID=3155521 RepID=UPI00344070E7